VEQATRSRLLDLVFEGIQARCSTASSRPSSSWLSVWRQRRGSAWRSRSHCCCVLTKWSS